MGSAGGAEQARPTDRAQLPGERLTAGCAGGGVSRGRVLQARWAPGLATIEPLDAPGWGPKPSPRTLGPTTFYLNKFSRRATWPRSSSPRCAHPVPHTPSRAERRYPQARPTPHTRAALRPPRALASPSPPLPRPCCTAREHAQRAARVARTVIGPARARGDRKACARRSACRPARHWRGTLALILPQLSPEPFACALPPATVRPFRHLQAV